MGVTPSGSMQLEIKEIYVLGEYIVIVRILLLFALIQGAIGDKLSGADTGFRKGAGCPVPVN